MSDAPLYLDANASVPLHPAARDAVTAALSSVGNPSSPHRLGRLARRALDDARDAIAAGLLADARDVVFTSGASEANRWLCDALVLRGRDLGRPLRVWTTPLEHPSWRRPLELAAARGDITLHVGALDDVGQPVVDDGLAGADAAVVTLAHNETGLLPRLDELCAALDDDTLLLGDAAQAFARLPAPPARVDAIAVSAHKVGGVAGAGALVVRRRARALPAPWSGGGQEAGLRPGTEPVLPLVAFGAAAAHLDDIRAAHTALVDERDALERGLLDALPNAFVIGARGARLPNTTALCFPDRDGEALRMRLDRSGLCVGFGAACSSLAPEPSESLLALGLSPSQARATVRLSLAPDPSRPPPDEIVRRFVAALGPPPR